MGFNQAKKSILIALKNGEYQHEVRDDYITKNLLQTGEISAQDVINIINASCGTDHNSSSHHQVSKIDVHVIRKNGWYIKFYFVDDDGENAWFISVHQ